MKSLVDKTRNKMKIGAHYHQIGVQFKGVCYYALIICLMTLYILSWLTSNHQQQQTRLYVIDGGSMLPQLNIGDLVLVTAQKNYQVNQIVTYNRPRTSAHKGLKPGITDTITHRIIKIKREPTSTLQATALFLTQGDANPIPDGWIEQQQIVGRVRLSLPFVGKLILWLQTDQGKLWGIYLPVVLIFFIELKRLQQPN